MKKNIFIVSLFAISVLSIGLLLGCTATVEEGTATTTTTIVESSNAPTVASTSPSDEATGVSVFADITVTFSKALDITTLTNASFTLASNEAAVSGGITFSNGSKTVTFDPTSTLSYGTTYTATISASVTDSSGVSMSAPYTWSFTTFGNADAITVASTSPTDEATGVSVATNITALFLDL